MAAYTLTYATLTTALQTITEDDSTEFVAAIPDCIGLAEHRIHKEIDLDISRQTDSVTLSASVNTATKPTGFVIERWAYITSGSTKSFLTQKDSSWIHDYWPSTSATGVPLYYADKDSTTWWIAPTPDIGYTMTLAYTKLPDKLDASTTTTWLSTNAPDVLLYACLVEAGIFLRDIGAGPNDPGMMQIWDGRYQGALARLRDEQMRRQRMSESTYGESRGEV